MSLATNQPRPLTYDEKKAAEAAFRGVPFDSSWSESALKVYEGLRLAIARRKHAATTPFDVSRN